MVVFGTGNTGSGRGLGYMHQRDGGNQLLSFYDGFGGGYYGASYSYRLYYQFDGFDGPLILEYGTSERMHGARRKTTRF